MHKIYTNYTGYSCTVLKIVLHEYYLVSSQLNDFEGVLTSQLTWILREKDLNSFQPISLTDNELPYILQK